MLAEPGAVDAEDHARRATAHGRAAAHAGTAHHDHVATLDAAVVHGGQGVVRGAEADGRAAEAA
jgi:hypothetical protein